MENSEMVRESLQEFTSDELFYREYYYAKNAGDPAVLADFLNRHSAAEVKARKLLCPELSGKITEVIDEKNYYKMDRQHNIRIEKHNRYAPLFVHAHEYYELFYVLSGSCRHYINGGETTLHKGTLCFISPHVRHQLGVFDDNSIILNILIQRTTFDDIFFNTIRSKNILSQFFMSSLTDTSHISHLLFQLDDAELEDLLLNMILEESVEDKYTNQILNSIMNFFFVKLMRKYEKTAQVYYIGAKPTQAQSDLLAYIYDNYKTVTLEELADHFHYTPEHCSRLLHQITGQTFVSFLRSIRLRRAEGLLLSTSASIEEISALVGYENPGTLISLFKKTYGVSPGQYRKQNAGYKI